eukprot:CAMPEP_0183428690 /NCGR_PEP_ID=MMETSP0370-20130417/45573_1 /TAXON_ID=268820 /ORGANISM="Peridinium aciculiferum, Strain PAER-2" /LENGTH=50 /DNA_ID=CAMNT_0025613549 /DNA_START=13 /DNA_END=162 /DNA_ORIENTATION=+
MIKNSASSSMATFLSPGRWGILGKIHSLMALGQNFTAKTMAMPMKMMPMM